MDGVAGRFARVEAFVARRERALRWGIVAAYVVAGAVNLVVGAFPHDEGFYAYAATRVFEGDRLYADILYVQAPLTPYVYGLPQVVTGPDLYVQRAVGLAISAAGLLVAMAVADRLGGRVAGLSTGLLVAATLFFEPHHVSPLTLTALLLALSVGALLSRRLGPYGQVAVAGVFLGLASGVRLNVVAAFPVLVGFAWLRAGGGARHAALAGLAAGGTAALAYLPFILPDPASAWWNLVGYHRLDGVDPSHSLVQLAKYKLDGVGYMLDAYGGAVAWGLIATGVLALAPKRHATALYVAVLTVVVVAANFSKTYIQGYWLSAAVPLLGVLAGVGVAALREQLDAKGRAFAALAFIVVIAVSVASVLPANIYRNEDRHKMSVIHEVGDHLAAVTPPGAPVFSLFPVFPAMADRPAMDGLAMGQLGFYPTMGTDEARALHAMNVELAREAISARSAAAVVRLDGDFTYTTMPAYELKGEALAAMVEELNGLIDAHYRLDRRFGDGPGAVEVWLPRLRP